MAIKVNTKQTESLNAVNTYMASLLPLFKEAVARDEWDGLTGSKKIIGNIEIFTEKKGDAAKNLAFEGFFKAMSEIVTSRDDKTTSLKEFTKKYMDFTLKLAKKSPELFIGENAKVAKTCKSVMDTKQKAVFERNLDANKNLVNAKVAINESFNPALVVNENLTLNKEIPTFAERILQSREENSQQMAR